MYLNITNFLYEAYRHKKVLKSRLAICFLRIQFIYSPIQIKICISPMKNKNIQKLENTSYWVTYFLREAFYLCSKWRQELSHPRAARSCTAHLSIAISHCSDADHPEVSFKSPEEPLITKHTACRRGTKLTSAHITFRRFGFVLISWKLGPCINWFEIAIWPLKLMDLWKWGVKQL